MSTIRLSGMASGMDTDSIVEQLMKAEKQKTYKTERQVYKTEYQIEAYRGVTDKLNKFKSSYLDLLSSTNMTSGSTYRKFNSTVTNSAGTASKAVEITSTSSANVGSHSVQINQVASKAMIDGVKATGNLQGAEITDFNLYGSNIEVTVDGKKKNIILDNYADLNEMQSDIQGKLNDAFGVGFDGSNGKVAVLIDGNALKLQTTNGSTNMSVYDETDSLKLINTSTTLNTTTDLENLSSSFCTGLTFGTAYDGDTENDTIKFKINDKVFKFDKSTTLKEVMNEINSDLDVNVNMTYNSTSGKFSITSDEYGASEKVEIEDISGNFFAATGLIAAGAVHTAGADTLAIVDGVELSRSSTTFSIDGIGYKANEVTSGEVTVDLKLNTDEVYDGIIKFVESYNTLISEIDTLVNEEYDRDYQPLTEDERAEMTDEQIEKWDKKAKSGLLRNDSTLNSLLSELRSCFSQGVSGVGMTISDIGLKTGTYTGKGKIVIDESAQKSLKNALANNLDTVVDLFTKKSEAFPYASRTYTNEQRTTRMSQQGLMYRLSDVLDGYVSTYRDNDGYKGKLLEKAGLVGDTTEATSALSKRLADYDSKLSKLQDALEDKYERYYKKFSAMETAIQNANSQQSYLTSMFSQGK